MPWFIRVMTCVSISLPAEVRGTRVAVARGTSVSSRSTCPSAVGTVTLFCGFGRISPTARMDTSISPGAVFSKWRMLSRSGTL
jgi:hypothetical protein